MTPSDEAAVEERVARALIECDTPHVDRTWEGPLRERYLERARAALAAFPSEEQPGGDLPDDVKRNTYTADREPGLHVQGLRTASGEYQRAVSDVVEALRPGGWLSGFYRFADDDEDAAAFIERRFAPTSEGEE